MGLHICNNCDYKSNCTKAFENSLICSSLNKKVRKEQEKRFDNTEFKEFKEFLES